MVKELVINEIRSAEGKRTPFVHVRVTAMTEIEPIVLKIKNEAERALSKQIQELTPLKIKAESPVTKLYGELHSFNLRTLRGLIAFCDDADRIASRIS
jgi:hypothetical protein